MRITTLSNLPNWKMCRQDERPSYPRPQVEYLDWIPARVPGSVYTDLQAAAIIGDPFRGAQEVGVQWVEEASWTYRCEFDWQPGDGLPRRTLSFEGLDTVCSVSLNGEVLAEHDNMFLPLEVDVTSKLQPGKNKLDLAFASAVKIGEQRRADCFGQEGLPWETNFFEERAFVRKAGYMSGWDWGPRLVGAGIWKPVRLLEFEARIVAASFLQQRLPSGAFRVWVEATVDGPGRLGAEFGGQVRKPGEELEFVVEDPQLWWPRGEGDAYLYEARLFLEGSGHEIHKRIGLRTVSLIQEGDDVGRSFEFEVNGRRIWIRGANWIPDDSLPGRIRDEDTRQQVGRAASLGMNMLRIWGGGFYESEAFYDACDEAGMLVWQDFPYACSYHPDGPEEREVAKAEAVYHIVRLRDRASLALWCGNNENLAMYEAAWGGSRPSRLYGEELYDQILPKTVAELDPAHDYIPTSPLVPSDENRSDSHFWDVWHGRGDWRFYVDSKARFASEFGFASSCSMASWESVLDERERTLESPLVHWHNKTHKAREVFEGFVSLHYPQSQSLQDWVYYSQLNQRDALRQAVEHYRRGSFCRGALIWQFNDCWPVQSWAVQDYARLMKPAAFELARLYAPLLLSLEQTAEGAKLHLVNDSAEQIAATIVAEVLSTRDGSLLEKEELRCELGPGGRQVIRRLNLPEEGRNGRAIRARIEGVPSATTWLFFGEPKDALLGSPTLEPEVREGRLLLSVNGLARDLVVWDPQDPYNVFDPATGQPGWKAITGANEQIEIRLHTASRQLAARSLAGDHVLRTT